MPRDTILGSRFFQLLFKGDKELETLGKIIAKVDFKELYAEPFINLDTKIHQ